MRRSSFFTAIQTRPRQLGVIAPRVLAFCTAGSMLPASLADVIEVPQDQPTIQAGIDVASDGDVVLIAAGTYQPDSTIDTLGKAITVQGAVDASGLPATIVDGQGERRVFQVLNEEDAATIFENLLVTGGQASFGGGMFIEDSGPTLANCRFENNVASDSDDCRGGGIYVRNGDPTLTDCVFKGNTVSGTDMSFGGGLYANSGRASLVDCRFIENSSSVAGGGLYTNDASVSLTGCGFEQNTAGESDSRGYGGGGVHCIRGIVYVVDTTLCGNLPDQVRGEFIDGGENCLAVSCTDADGDGVADNCVDDGPDILQVPSEYSTISAAVAAAGIGDIVEIEAGVHPLQERIDIDGQRITIRGALAKDGRPATTIDGTGLDLALYSSNCGDDTVIENLRFIGSGVYLLSGSPTIVNCVFDGIESARGALFCEYASPTLRNCVFENNLSSSFGGGMACWSLSSPKLIDCVFRNNVSPKGGGLHCFFRASPVLNGCVFEGNSATSVDGVQGGHGGGMYCDGGSPVLIDCRFQDNTTIGSQINYTGSIGGGFYCEDASPSLAGCTFLGNSSITGGGASFYRCDSILADCVFESNRSDRIGNSQPIESSEGSGGGIYAGEYQSTLTLSDCVFAGNTAARFGAGLRNAGPWLSIQGCVFQSNIAELTSGGMAFYSLEDGVKMTDTIFCGNQPNQISSYFFVDDGDNCFRNHCIDHDGDGVADCGDVETDLELSVPDEYPSIAHALDAAAPGAVIDVAAGTYRPDFALSTLGKPLLIRGSTDERGDPTTIIDGQGEHTVFCVEGPEGITTGFENLVITGGSGVYGGGMFDLSTGALSVVNAVFTGNEASRGGGLYSYVSYADSTKALVGSVFNGNSSYDGGGVFGFGLTLTDTVVCGNTPDQVDGSSNMTVTSCISRICLDCDPCGADFNGDFKVDGADLSILMAAWGDCEGCPADLNGDGMVDMEDLSLLQASWGICAES